MMCSIKSNAAGWFSLVLGVSGSFDKNWTKVQVILFEIDCAIFYTNLHELFCQFISWTNWVNSGKFMDNCWISGQVMADMENLYDDLININLYVPTSKSAQSWKSWIF